MKPSTPCSPWKEFQIQMEAALLGNDDSANSNPQPNPEHPRLPKMPGGTSVALPHIPPTPGSDAGDTPNSLLGPNEMPPSFTASHACTD